MRHVTHGSNRIFAILSALYLGLAVSVAASVAAADFDAGLSAFLDGDYRYAREIWLDLAADGDAQSQFGLGMMYESGRGVPPDTEKAFDWYSRAAAQGMIEAQLSLGSLYEHGRGVARDPERAAELYLDAAERGNAQAQYNLGALYLGGEGITPDRERGIRWLRLAAAQRYGRAIQRLNIMGVDLEAPQSDPPRVAEAGEAAETAENAAPEPAPEAENSEQLQILVEGNQFEVPIAALEEVEGDIPVAGEAPPGESDFSVLLATFDREDAAAEAWEAYVDRFPALFETLQPKFTAHKMTGGKTVLWRLEAARLASEAAAVALCDALRQAGEYCFPRRAGGSAEE